MTNSEITSVMNNYVAKNGSAKVLEILAKEALDLSTASMALSCLIENDSIHKGRKAKAIRVIKRAVSNIEMLEIMLDIYPQDSYQDELLELLRA